MSYYSYNSAYDGANWSERRGHINWTTLDTRLELDSFSREELVRRVRWLSKNIGFVKGIIHGLSDLVGYLTPEADTGDLEWNAAAEVNFMSRAGSPLVFDAAGKFDFFDAQILQTRSWLRDGDLVTLLTRSPSNGAQFSFFESHRLRNPKGAGDSWMDGIRATTQGRHQRYGLTDKNGNVRHFSARDVLYFGDWSSCGHHRCEPPLAHAVNHAVDITEIWADTKHAIKTSGLVAAVITNNDEKSAGMRRGLGHNLATRQNRAGDPFNSADVWEGAGGSIPELDKGKDMKIVHDARPHPNIRDQIRDLIRDISLGTKGCPPEVVWEMAGLNGPSLRFMMEKLERWIMARQKPLKAWSQRVWMYHIAKEVEAGRLRPCRDEMWWKVNWIGQKSMTIDRSKDKDQLDLYDGGMTTLADYYSQRGADWQSRVTQKIIESRFIKDECKRLKMEPDEVFRPRQGAAVISSEISKENDDDE